MFEGASVERLDRFANGCRLGKNLAIDPLTRKELEEFEKVFRQHEADAEEAAESAGILH